MQGLHSEKTVLFLFRMSMIHIIYMGFLDANKQLHTIVHHLHQTPLLSGSSFFMVYDCKSVYAHQHHRYHAF